MNRKTNKNSTENILGKELYRLSLDSVEEETFVPWNSLIQNLTYEQLEELKSAFKSGVQDVELQEGGLTKDEFVDVIKRIYGNSKYCLQSILLFEKINISNKTRVTWNDFIDFLMENIEPKIRKPFELEIVDIFPVPHTKREAIVKIVLIETEKYFCYALIAKYGRVGLYDGNMNFLTSYHVVMTKEDENRTDAERRRRNRWVTDAVFCPDALMFIITNTSRSIAIYEASGLKHVLQWLILSTPYIIQCLDYKPYTENDKTSILFAGDDNGIIISYTFLKPDKEFLRKKRNEGMTLFYWMELPEESEFVKIRNHGKNHKQSINRIYYFADNETLMTCSCDPDRSLVKTHIDSKKKEYIFKMKWGATTVDESHKLKILITGSKDGLIRLWNPVMSVKPIAILEGHNAEVVDIKIIESESLFLSCSFDGVLILWDIKDQKSIQTIKIKFPSFRVAGKLIEWGVKCIYPGPKRDRVKTPPARLEQAEGDCYNIDEVGNEYGSTYPTRDVSITDDSDIISRSHVFVQCCNYLAKIMFNFSDKRFEEIIENPILPPPPLQNSVLIPKTWNTYQDGAICTKRTDLHPNTADGNVGSLLEELKFILERNFLPENGASDGINFKIAHLESTKLQMKEHVAKGAPYLALDLHDIDTLRLSNVLPIPSNRKSRYYYELAHKLLEDAEHMDLVFSEPSSTRSRSSRSSIVEFP